MYKYLLYFSILFTLSASAQEPDVYNINVYNGLSSNHVYVTVQDNFGYLWIGTLSGVYKYNGYNLKKFDYKDGLTNIDIWGMFADSKGRIWLKGISNQLGYIKNDKYHSVYIPPNTILPQIYPTQMQEFNGSLIFRNRASLYAKESLIFTAKDDTIHAKHIPDGFRSNRYESIKYISPSFVVELQENEMYLYNTRDWLKSSRVRPVTNFRKIQHPINFFESFTNNTIDGLFAGKYIFFAEKGGDKFSCYNIITNTLNQYPLNEKNEEIVHTYNTPNELHILSSQNTYVLDSNLQVKRVYATDSLFNKHPASINSTYFLNNPFWGSCLSTDNNGLYINYANKPFFRRPPVDISAYRYVGRCDDSTGCWWSENKKTLLQTCNGTICHSYHLPQIIEVRKVTNVYGRLLLTSRNRSLWLQKDGAHVNLSEPIKNIFFNRDTLKTNGTSVAYYDDIFRFIRAYAFTDTNQFFYSGSFGGTLKATLNYDHLTIDSIYFERYQNFCHNSKHNIVICYSSDKLMYINTLNNSKHVLSTRQLNTLDITGIENIQLDDFGNIFIKDYSKLLVYNIYTKKTKRLFSNYILEGAIIDVYQNKLNIAGVFGVIEGYVYGAQKIFIRNIYPNTKHIYYNFVKDVQFSKNNVLLNTEKGTYYIERGKRPGQSTSADLFNCVIKLDSTQQLVRKNDTIRFARNTTFADIDIIKPTGTGTLNITYAINQSDYINSGTQLILSDLQPGTYNTVSLIAFDNNWKSKPIRFYVYIHPAWWQTRIAQNIFLALSLLLLGGLIYTVYIITRRVVNRNNDRKNLQRELELKSIYSQINPHFIFNSLSTAQYFIKKNRNKEAFEHISQFSNLLRAYIKSSRDKYISIADELVNLENYLQLQLSRFEDKFEYSFFIDELINGKLIKIPSLLLQPIVENALNHGIFHSKQKGVLLISFTLDKDGNLICAVDDNGVGRIKSKEMRSEMIKKADSYGSILIKELIDTFNKYETIKIRLEYIDKQEPETGTTVVITIKNYLDVK